MDFLDIKIQIMIIMNNSGLIYREETKIVTSMKTLFI